MKYIIKTLIILLMVTSCKSNKRIADANTIDNISTKKIINNHYNNNFDQKTVYAKLSAKYRSRKC